MGGTLIAVLALGPDEGIPLVALNTPDEGIPLLALNTPSTELNNEGIPLVALKLLMRHPIGGSKHS